MCRVAEPIGSSGGGEIAVRKKQENGCVNVEFPNSNFHSKLMFSAFPFTLLVGSLSVGLFLEIHCDQ